GSGYALEREEVGAAARPHLNTKLSRDKVEHAIGRARALIAAQRMHLDTAQKATLQLRAALSENGHTTPT
ncbi:MAG TPA: hypothetical protein VF137_10425, partial [Candidatus Dormibacteraeota bacterium]